MNKRLLLFIGFGVIIATAWLVWMDMRFQQYLLAGKRNLALHASQKSKTEVDRRFNEAVMMLHAKQYEYAVKSLHRVLEINPNMPEAYVNMGFALLGLEDFQTARDFFQGAIELKPMQVNAYFGLGEAMRALKDYEGALGAMNTYIHLAAEDDAFAAKAREMVAELNIDMGRKQGGGTPSPAPPHVLPGQ